MPPGLCLSLPLSLSICLSLPLSLSLPLCLSVSLSLPLCLSVFVSLSLSLSLSLRPSLYFCLSVSHPPRAHARTHVHTTHGPCAPSPSLVPEVRGGAGRGHSVLTPFRATLPRPVWTRGSDMLPRLLLMRRGRDPGRDGGPCPAGLLC